jgi:hypothetical protein
MQYLLLRKPKQRPTDSDDDHTLDNTGIVLGPWGEISFETGSLVASLSYREKFTTSEKVYLARALSAEDLRSVLSMDRPVAASIPIRNSHVYYDGLYYARVTLITAEKLILMMTSDYDREVFLRNYCYVMYNLEHTVMPATVGVGAHGKSYGRAMNLGGNSA